MRRLKKKILELRDIAHDNMLRTRLVLGLMTLLLILLVVGLYSIRTCNALAGAISEAYEDNYASIQAMQEIKLACAKLNGAVVMKMAWENKEGIALYQRGLALLKKNLEIQQAKKPQGEELEWTEMLAATCKEYERESRGFFNLPAGTKSVPRHLIVDLSPLTEKIATMAAQISDMNNKSIRDNKDAAKLSAWRTMQFMFLAMVIAVVVALYASFRLGHGILEPLADLTASIQRIGGGDLRHRVAVRHRDELGHLAETVNSMANQLYLYQQSQSGKLIRLHKTLERTLASYPDPIFVIAKDNRMEFMNPAGQWFLTGLPAQEEGRFPVEIDVRIAEALKKGEDYLAEKLRLAMRFEIEGDEVFYLLKVLVLREEDGGIFGVAVVLEDVSKLRLVDDMKSNLISTVSHELKTPLTGLRMALHLLDEQVPGTLNVRQAELVGTAKEETERLLQTLNNLLDLARLEEVEINLKLESRQLGPIVEDSIEEASYYLRQKGQTVRLEETEPLPPVEVNVARIHHVFTNLLTNACKHSPENAEIFVRLSPGPEGGIRVSVLDKGAGIPPEHLTRIFERFYRVPGQKRTGAGLGLSIAQEIAQAHGATIGVFSEVGKGSEFYVDFPARKDGKVEKPPDQNQGRLLRM